MRQSSKSIFKLIVIQETLIKEKDFFAAFGKQERRVDERVASASASAVTNLLPKFVIFGVYLRKFVLVYMDDIIERKPTSSERSPVSIKEISSNVIPKEKPFRASQH